MVEKTIMLVCAAGMSTSMLVKRMQESADAKNLSYDIFAVAASEADHQLSNKDIDVIMLGPQVKYLKSQFDEKGAKYNIPIGVIDMRDYGMMKGEKVLEDTVQLIDDYSR